VRWGAGERDGVCGCWDVFIQSMILTILFFRHILKRGVISKRSDTKPKLFILPKRK
jgi:hypothetical protein